MKLSRGHIYTADLNPRFGTEARKTRPVLVIQTNLINGEHPSTLICPITTKVRSEVEIMRVHLGEKESGLNEKSDVMIDQLRAIDNRRFKREIGKLSTKKLLEIEEKIRIILDLS